mgnify:CR=1 FL=1
MHLQRVISDIFRGARSTGVCPLEAASRTRAGALACVECWGRETSLQPTFASGLPSSG